jgi:hypothetical protein
VLDEFQNTTDNFVGLALGTDKKILQVSHRIRSKKICYADDDSITGFAALWPNITA